MLKMKNSNEIEMHPPAFLNMSMPFYSNSNGDKNEKKRSIRDTTYRGPVLVSLTFNLMKGNSADSSSTAIFSLI